MRDSLLCNRGLGKDTGFFNLLCCSGGVVSQQGDGRLIVLQECQNLFRMLFGKLGADDDAALYQAARFCNAVPLFRQVQDDLQVAVLTAGNGDHRFRQNRQMHLPGGDCGVQFRRLGIGVVDADTDVVRAAQKTENEARVLCRNIDSLPVEIRKAFYGNRAVREHIQHAAGVQGQNLNPAFCFVVQRGGRVGRECGNVAAAVDERGGDV